MLEIDESTAAPKPTDVPPSTDHSIAEANALNGAALPTRNRLPDTRQSVTHKFSVCGYEGYLVVGLYDDGRPGELFIKIAKQGSTLAGLANSIGILTSVALQYGVPAEALARKFEDMRFEPSGSTKNAE
jgi:ribonucleoside-diphosphate reductase alpha chain